MPEPEGNTGETTGDATQQTPPETGEQTSAADTGGATEQQPDWASLGSFDEVKEALDNARKWEKRAKNNKDKADKFDSWNEQNKSEAQQATDRAEKAEQSAQAHLDRAVTAEIKAAATDWQDPSDAPRYLDDKSKYVTADGDIDSKAIKADLKAELKQRPHLGKQSATGDQPSMKPDPAQGASGQPSLEAQIAEANQKGDVRKALQLKSQQLLANNKK